jgi:lipoyl(octanoyl) transferase
MTPIARWLGRVDYEPTWRAMQRLTDARDSETADEFWFLEHPPVYTLGLAGKDEHVLAAGDIPVVRIDRGGQVTYHGPGQLVVYPLIDVKRLGIGVRALVTALETAIVDAVSELGVSAYSRPEAPGVYVSAKKIASIGLRIRRGATYHGLALNVSMDLEPFTRINPCGYAGLEVTDLHHLAPPITPQAMAEKLLPHLVRTLRLPEVPVWQPAPDQRA